MRTRITELLGIEHPILLSGMSWISVPELVAAVSNAGGLGLLATGVFNARQTRDAVRRVRELTDKPFGANVPLYFPGAKDNARALLEEKVPVINFSMGKGDWIAEAAHAYGGKVIATVVNERHARSAVGYGTDAVLVTGHEAAGHAGAVGTLVLVPSIADAVSVPVIAAGGVGDGRGLAAVLALGGEGVALGTRLMSTRESPVAEACKQLATEKGAEDTVYTTRFDGLPCRVLRSPGSARAIRRGLDLPRAFLNSREIARMLDVPYTKLALGVATSGVKNAMQLAYLANAFKAFRLSCVDGDVERGVLPLGQTTALVHDVPTVQEVLDRVVAEAQAAQARLAKAAR
jgi:enoyl-[acyl-carrier protein] reductase II